MPPSPQRPNLLYIHSDQHNPYVMGCAGDRVVETPNLDRLAAEGVRCTQVYCPLGVRKRAAEVVDPFSLSVGFMLPHSPYLARRHLYDFYRERIGPPAVRQPFASTSIRPCAGGGPTSTCTTSPRNGCSTAAPPTGPWWRPWTP